jgi:micrococcal nuclease
MGDVGKLLFGIVAVALLAIGACQQRSSATGPPGRATVLRIVDGDTLHVNLGGRDETVRLVGVDTPETHGRGGLRECFGQEATRRLESLLPKGAPLTVVRDVEARDRYGRLLAYIYRAGDGLFVNLAMARDGYAVSLTIPPNVAHADEFVTAAGDARRANRGLWAACGGADTPIP